MTSRTLAQRIVQQRLDNIDSYLAKMRQEYGDKLVQEAINMLSTIIAIANGGKCNG